MKKQRQEKGFQRENKTRNPQKEKGLMKKNFAI